MNTITSKSRKTLEGPKLVLMSDDGRVLEDLGVEKVDEK